MAGAVGRPAARYGDAGPGRRRLLVVLAVVLAVGAAAWVVWAGLAQDGGGVEATTQGHRVVDDSEVLVTFGLTKPAGETVRCSVQALSSGAAQVGLASVDVGPAAGASSVQTVTVRTQQRADTGLVLGCTKVA